VKRQRITELSPEEVQAEEAAQAVQGAEAAAQQLAAARLAAAQAARASAMLGGQDTDAYPEGGSDGEGAPERGSESHVSEGAIVASSGIDLRPASGSLGMVVPPSVAAMMPPGWDILAAAPPKKPFSDTHLKRLREASRALWAHRHGIGPAPVTAAAKALAKRKMNAANIARLKAEEAAHKRDEIEKREEARKMKYADAAKVATERQKRKTEKEEATKTKKQAKTVALEQLKQTAGEREEEVRVKKEARKVAKQEQKEAQEEAAKIKSEADAANDAQRGELNEEAKSGTMVAIKEEQEDATRSVKDEVAGPPNKRVRIGKKAAVKPPALSAEDRALLSQLQS